MIFKKYLQVFHPTKINIGIRMRNLIRIRMLLYILFHQRLEIVSGSFHSKRHHIRTYTIAIIRITIFIVFALIFWLCIHISKRSLQNVRLVIYPILVRIRFISELCQFFQE